MSQDKTVKERVQEELDDLNIKIYKLKNFIFTKKFNELDWQNKKLLQTQLQIMCGYAKVLEIRLEVIKE